MLGTCQSYSRQAEKIVSEVRMREAAVLMRNLKKMIADKDAELKKVKDRLEKEVKKSVARSASGSRAALVGVKSVNRSKLQIEKIAQVRAYLVGMVEETKEVVRLGRETPAKMILPTDTEKLKKEIKKIEKQVEKADSVSTISTVEESEQFLKELQELDALHQ
jgi:hypothetical protein